MNRMLPNGVRAGAVLARKYRLLECLGKGGMGQVWRAHDVVLGAPVAVKVIDPDLLETHENKHEVVARFLREAQAAAALRSPHVAQILEFGVDDDNVPFMAMELLEGETLAERLARVRVLPYADTARIMTHIARAMARAHELGIVHRDLKPGNIFLTKNDDEELAKVMDFGIAKRFVGALDDRGVNVTRTGRIVGTPAYMSPEQTVGNKPVDARSDLWALGVIAFECVVGKRPFEGASHGELTLQIVIDPLPVPSQTTRVPPGFDAWFERATARDPEKRFQSARELSEALRSVLLQPGLLPPDVPKLPPQASADTQRGLATSRTLRMPARRGGRVLIGVMLGCLTGLAVLGFLIWRDRTHRRQAADAIEESGSAEGAAESGVPSSGTVQAAAPATVATPTPIVLETVAEPEPTVAPAAPSVDASAAVQSAPPPQPRPPTPKPRAPRSEPGRIRASASDTVGRRHRGPALDFAAIFRLALAIALALTPLAPARASAAPPANDTAAKEAKSLGRAGLTLFDKGDYAGALENFKRAYAMYPVPTLGVFTARSLVKLGRLLEARELYGKVVDTPLERGADAAMKRAIEDASRERADVAARDPDGDAHGPRRGRADHRDARRQAARAGRGRRDRSRRAQD